MSSFSELGLDTRLLRALAKKGLEAPTPVQAAAIPKALEGSDLVVRARTGTGKTLAYLLPLMHTLLAQEAQLQAFAAVVLVPTSELVEQVRYTVCLGVRSERMKSARPERISCMVSLWCLAHAHLATICNCNHCMM